MGPHTGVFCHEQRALLCEALTSRPASLRGKPVLGIILRYSLMTPEKTARMITSWAGLFPDGKEHGGPPTVTLLAHGDAGMLDQEHFQIRPESGIFTLTRTGPDGQPGLGVTLDETGTIMELTAALTRMAQ
jgi:hypothetical protein